MNRQLVKCICVLCLIITLAAFFVFTGRSYLMKVFKGVNIDTTLNSKKVEVENKKKLKKDDRNESSTCEFLDKTKHKNVSFYSLLGSLSQNLTSIFEAFGLQKYKPLIPLVATVVKKYVKFLSENDNNFAQVVFSKTSLAVQNMSPAPIV